MLALSGNIYAQRSVKPVRAKAQQPERIVSDANLHVNRINQVHHAFPELNGRGLVVSLKETAYDPSDIDLRGRHLPGDTVPPEGLPHASVMATLLAGGGSTLPTSRGVAWGAQIRSASFNNLFPDNNYEALGISVQNHSYGTQIESFYGAEAQTYDRHSNEHPTLLHVFSAGNRGQQTDSVGVYRTAPGFGNLTGNYKQAKNVLVVGATDEQLRIDSLVSRGPAHDGRIKPELVAYSTEGSSGAATMVSGTALLLQQAYRQQHNALPPTALLKAILLNSARDVGPTGPDFFSGYGSLDAHRALQTLQNERYTTASVGDQETVTFDVEIPANAQNLKVTLAWLDPVGSEMTLGATPDSDDSPAPIGQESVLVNDIDVLLVNTSSQEQWLPWVLSTTPTTDSLTRPARRGVDSLNPVEQITVAQPTAGTYQVRMTGTRVPAGPQELYVAVQWDTADQLEWTSPTTSDNVPQDGALRGSFRWISTYEAGTRGQLDVRIGKTDTWQTLGDVDLSDGYYAWNPPEGFARAQARITVHDRVYASDTFVVSRTLRPAIGFSCGDSALLQWNPVAGADAYVLYALGEQYMNSTTTVTDTSAVIYPPTQNAWYAVAPYQEGGLGIRSEAVDLRRPEQGCFVSSFIAGAESESGVSLLLELGTLYQLRAVQFERWNGTAFEMLGETINVDQTLLSYVDQSARQGRNLYRARLLFRDGTALVSEAATVYYLTEQPVLIFPNPVGVGQPLNVFTRMLDEPGVLTLYNATGQKVLTQTLASAQETIPPTYLTAGVYLYEILAKDQRFSGQLIVK